MTEVFAKAQSLSLFSLQFFSTALYLTPHTSNILLSRCQNGKESPVTSLRKIFKRTQSSNTVTFSSALRVLSAFSHHGKDKNRRKLLKGTFSQKATTKDSKR
jgi:hypothetical protein